MGQFEIGHAIGRSRQAVDSYIADLRASIELDLDLKIFRMHRISIPQERIAKRLGVIQRTVSNHLEKMPSLAIILNTDLSKGFTVAQVAGKHGWAEPLVWSIALEGKSDLDRFKALNWGLRTWDLWNWTDCLPREIFTPPAPLNPILVLFNRGETSLCLLFNWGM